MQKFFVAAAALLLAPAVAGAADLPSRAPVVAAPAFVAINWTGFYIGGHVGYAWSNADWTHNETAGLGGAVLTSERFSVSPDGFAGGVQGGARYQFANNLVVGVEAAYTWRDAHASARTDLDGFPRFRRADLRDIWSVTGQVGYAFGNMLGYVKGGYANTELSYANIAADDGAVLGASRSDVDGYTLGAGLEYAFSPSVSAGIEYNYYNFDVGSQNQLRNGSYAGAVNVSNDLDSHVVALRLNFRFGAR